MNIFDSIILGALQGVTEFLPVSSSGHLGIGRQLLGITTTDSIAFDLALHGATVLSTIVVFRKEIARLFMSIFHPKNNPDTKFVLKILLSAIPILIVGLTLESVIEEHLADNMMLIGCMLILTSFLLWFSSRIKRSNEHEITFKDAFVIGIAQAIAVMPGLSRSGTTISTGLLLGVKRAEVAMFSFLMVLIPVIGGNLLQIIKMTRSSEVAVSGGINDISVGVMIAGAITAFLVGVVACRWMINLVKKGNLNYFALYCLIVGIVTIILTLLK